MLGHMSPITVHCCKTTTCEEPWPRQISSTQHHRNLLYVLVSLLHCPLPTVQPTVVNEGVVNVDGHSTRLWPLHRIFEIFQSVHRVHPPEAIKKRPYPSFYHTKETHSKRPLDLFCRTDTNSRL